MPPRHQIPQWERAAVLSAIRSLGPVSRAELARSLDLRPSSVTEFVRGLISEGIVTEVGQGGSNGGRPPVLLDIDRQGNYAVGVTIEPRAIRAAVVRWDGTIISRATSSAASIFSTAAALEAAAIIVADEAVAAANVDAARVRGIGVGISAMVDPSANEVLFSSTFAAAGRFRLDGLAQHFGKPVHVEDIAYLMALGERWFVYPNDDRPLVFMLISSGTCGAVLEPWAPVGSMRFAAEFGHMVVDANGALCGCGRRGCLESSLSEIALVATANRLLAATGPQPLTLADVAALVRQGNPVAQRIVDAAAQQLGVAVANLASIFAPALFVIGGSVIEAWGQWLLPGPDSEVHSQVMDYLRGRVEIVPSRLGEDAPLLGSAARVLEAFFAAPQMSLGQ
ncbi:MAG: ROK family transcriptional regulator [Anaerolineae bacterium]